MDIIFTTRTLLELEFFLHFFRNPYHQSLTMPDTKLPTWGTLASNFNKIKRVEHPKMWVQIFLTVKSHLKKTRSSKPKNTRHPMDA